MAKLNSGRMKDKTFGDIVEGIKQRLGRAVHYREDKDTRYYRQLDEALQHLEYLSKEILKD